MWQQVISALYIHLNGLINVVPAWFYGARETVTFYVLWWGLIEYKNKPEVWIKEEKPV